jgi:hypothetical protein
LHSAASTADITGRNSPNNESVPLGLTIPIRVSHFSGTTKVQNIKHHTSHPAMVSPSLVTSSHRHSAELNITHNIEHAAYITHEAIHASQYW